MPFQGEADTLFSDSSQVVRDRGQRDENVGLDWRLFEKHGVRFVGTVGGGFGENQYGKTFDPLPALKFPPARNLDST